jgi:hypothetical protein
VTSLNTAILRHLVVRLDVKDYVRIVHRAYKDSPLGMGFGKTRFSSPNDAFKVLYLAQDTRTAIAETIIRDRFQSKAKRELLEEEFDDYSIAAIRNRDPLVLVDLGGRGLACSAYRPMRCARGRRGQAGYSVRNSTIAPSSTASSTCRASPTANASQSTIVPSPNLTQMRRHWICRGYGR